MSQKLFINCVSTQSCVVLSAKIHIKLDTLEIKTVGKMSNEMELNSDKRHTISPSSYF